MQGRIINAYLASLSINSAMVSNHILSNMVWGQSFISSTFSRLVTKVQEGNLAEVERLLPEVKDQKDGEEKIRHNTLGHCKILDRFMLRPSKGSVNILKLLLRYGAETVEGNNPLLSLFVKGQPILKMFNQNRLEAAKTLIAYDCKVPKDIVKNTIHGGFAVINSVDFYDRTNTLIWFIHLGATWKYDRKDMPEFNAPAEVKHKFDIEVKIAAGISLNLDPLISVNFYKIYQELLNSFISSLTKSTGNLWPKALLGVIIDYVGYLGDKLQLSAADSQTFYQAGERLKALGLFRRSSPVENIQTQNNAVIRTPTLRLMPPPIDDVD